MLDLRLRFDRSLGAFRPAGKLDYELANGEYEDGELVRAKTSHARSVRQNDYFHALVEAAYDNQRGGPQLPSWRHLKSWLLIQAGHCDVKKFEPRSLTPAVAAYLRQQFDTVDFTTDGDAIYMKTARSVRFGRGGPSHDEMSAIVDRVVALICTDIVPGCSPDEMMSAARARAAT